MTGLHISINGIIAPVKEGSEVRLEDVCIIDARRKWFDAAVHEIASLWCYLLLSIAMWIFGCLCSSYTYDIKYLYAGIFSGTSLFIIVLLGQLIVLIIRRKREEGLFSAKEFVATTHGLEAVFFHDFEDNTVLVKTFSRDTFVFIKGQVCGLPEESKEKTILIIYDDRQTIIFPQKADKNLKR